VHAPRGALHDVREDALVVRAHESGVGDVFVDVNECGVVDDLQEFEPRNGLSVMEVISQRDDQVHGAPFLGNEALWLLASSFTKLRLEFRGVRKL